MSSTQNNSAASNIQPSQYYDWSQQQPNKNANSYISTTAATQPSAPQPGFVLPPYAANRPANAAPVAYPQQQPPPYTILTAQTQQQQQDIEAQQERALKRRKLVKRMICIRITITIIGLIVVIVVGAVTGTYVRYRV